MRPTFSGFNIAKRGLDAARSNLNITGQNMANVHTKGYTRQRVDLSSIGASGYNMRYASTSNDCIGEGVNINGINQIRDPYLDVRYRRENSKVGDTSTQLDTLTDLEYVFDEISKDGLDKQFTDMLSQLQKLAQTPADPVSEGIVKTSALMLVKMFNHCAEQINNVQDKQLSYLQDGAITKTNELLDSIAHISGEIRSANISGNQALELLDQRNTMIDELSNFVNIELTTKKTEIGGGIFVEELSINMIGSNGEKFNLVNNDDNRKFDLSKDLSGNVTHPVKILLKEGDGSLVGGSNKGTLSLVDGDISNQLTFGAFAGHLKMLNAAGEFDTPATTQRGIAYYENMLNTLASEFATAFNKANSTDNPTGVFDKPMFEINRASKDTTITAQNISISQKWENTLGSYITNTKPNSDGSTDTSNNNNVLYMISLFSSKVDYKSASGTPLFKGSFQGCFSHISSTLALEIKDITRQNDSYGSVLLEIDTQRASVSSVNMDEEGINLIQYNKSLTASSRFMTTLDEALETIINRMGVVGR